MELNQLLNKLSSIARINGKKIIFSRELTLKSDFAELIIKSNENIIAKVSFTSHDSTKVVENLEYACADLIFNLMLSSSYLAFGADND
jgi:hypothetical protein